MAPGSSPGLVAAEPALGEGVPALFASLGDPDRVAALVDSSPALASELDLAGALAPMIEFLAAEALRSVGREEEARPRYRRLARWSIREGAEESGVSSSLGLPALWRWVQLLDGLAEPPADEIREAASIARPLLTSSYSEPLVSIAVLPSLPQLEEGVLGHLSLLAWNHLSREMGQGFLVDLVAVSREEELSAAHRQIYDAVVAQGWASRDRLDLLRAQRLGRLGYYEAAMELLERLATGRDRHNRGSAILTLVQLQRATLTGSREEQRELLSRVIEESKDPYQRQEALYLRALRQGDEERRTADLERLLEENPEGPWADDAIFQLAVWDEGLWSVDPQNLEAWESARRLYARLRAFPGENDWQDSAYFRPALVLFTQGGAENLRRAVELLAEYDRDVPRGPFRTMARFWRARALEDLELTDQARSLFETLADEQGHRYFGLRARMHLASGPAAARQLWPAPAVQAELREAYEKGWAEEFAIDSVYHARLRAAIDTGLYDHLLEDLQEVSRRFPDQRLPTVSLTELGSDRLLTSVVLLLSLRQDAYSAAHWGESAGNHLRVQTAVGHAAGDWSAAISMAIGTADEYQGGKPIHELPGFLRAAYPPVFVEQIAAASARWRVPSELLYALMRRESLFSPTAHSRAGALGLFQFMPQTFDWLDGEPFGWGLLAEAGVDSRAEYLLDPERSLDLGARYFGWALMREWLCRLEFRRGCIGVRADRRPDLPPREEWFRADLPMPQRLVPIFALLEHSKGYPAVRDWRRRWETAGRTGDVEYMITTTGSREARILSRGVLTDAAIVRASGLFGGE